MRWRDYVLRFDDEIEPLWAGRDRFTLILAAGFDPRALVGTDKLATACPNAHADIVVIGLPESTTDPRAMELAATNRDRLDAVVAERKWSMAHVPFPDTATRRTAGQNISRALHDQGLIPADSLVIVDVSAMPSSIAFPVIGGILEAERQGKFGGDLQVLVCENSAIDQNILEEGADDPGPVGGFSFQLTESSENTIKIWAPLLGEGQSTQIDTVASFVEAQEITPILPFPAVNPRRADNLVIELRELLFGRLSVQPVNLIYAHETNPFDLYRTLVRLDERFTRALKPLRNSRLVLSVHGSKLLAMGVLLAAWERSMPVVTTVSSDYLIRTGVDLQDLVPGSQMACLWLAGEPYR